MTETPILAKVVFTCPKSHREITASSRDLSAVIDGTTRGDLEEVYIISVHCHCGGWHWLKTE